jgi:hypothetical protein
LIPQLNGHSTTQDEKEVIGFVVLVPDERAIRFDDHYIMPVERSNDPRVVGVAEGRELGGKIDLHS